MEWMLDPDVVHLNHGSFGGCLKSVFDAATAWRAKLEAAPMRWLVLEWQAELDRARAVLASFLAAPAERLVFVPNATTGVAIALRSLALPAGSQVITTNHAYRAVTNQLARAQLAVRAVEVPLPFDADQLVERIAAAITPDTKLAVLDHITSPTALVFPLYRILPLFRDRGIPVIVDGAHAPGQVPIDLASILALGGTYYTGNNHKWLCAPKASGFLVSAVNAPTVPVVTSHGASPTYGPTNRMHAEPWVNDRNQRIAGEMADRLAARLGATRISRSHAAMVALRITTPAPPFEIETQLLRDGWEVPIVDHAVGPLVRVSAHLYNEADQADALATKLLALGVRGR
jgi:isopenicillin-N epimerase